MPVLSDSTTSASFHYETLDRLGGGGMGVVYRAEDTKLKRTVALKFLPPELSEDLLAKERFLREARAAARLDHSNVAAVHDIGEDPEGRMFIAMAYYDGETIKKKIEHARTLGTAMPIRECLDLAEQIARGLAAAHAENIVHRDIKPANVMVTTNGQAKLVDFGLAKLAGTAPLTRAGQTPGTVAYMSPEQILGREVDHRTDLWSLGVVLYEMVAGRHPFGSDSEGSAVQAILNEQPDALADTRPDCSQVASNIVDALLQKDPDARLGDAAETAQRLADARMSADLTETLPRARREDLHPELARSEPRPRVLLGPSGWLQRLPAIPAPRLVLLAVLVLAALAVGLAVWRDQRSPVESSRPPSVALVVGEFRAGPGEEVFAASAREGLSTAFEQSGSFTVLSRGQLSQALERMRRPTSTAIDEAIGKEIALRENVDVLLTGSVQRNGARFRVVVRALDVGSGAVLFAGTREFSQDESPFHGVTELAAEMRTPLASVTSQRETLESVTTSSLEALQLYSRARSRMAEADLQGATRLLKSALQLDPEFAMAHLALAQCYSTRGDPDGMQRHYRQAYELREPTSDREQFRIEGLYHGSTQDYEKQIQAFEALVELFPDDLDAHTGLTTAYIALRDLDSAIRASHQVVRLAPEDSRARGTLIRLLALAGTTEEALSAYRKAVKDQLDSPHLLLGLGLAHVGKGELDRAEAVFTELEASGGAFEPMAGVNRARLALHRGRLDAAEDLLRRGIAADRSANRVGWENLRRHLLAKTLWLQGRGSEANEQLQMLLSRPELRDRDYRELGALSTELGELGRARQMLEALTALSQTRDDSFLEHSRSHLEGHIALAEGRFDAAVTHFQDAYRRYPGLVSQLGLARAAIGAGDRGQALEALTSLLSRRAGAYDSCFPASWPVAHLLAAAVLQADGDEAAADSHCNAFRAEWADLGRLVAFDHRHCAGTEPGAS